MSFSHILKSRWLSSYEIIAGEQLRHVLHREVLGTLSRHIRMVDLAVGYQTIGLELLELKLVDEILVTDISQLAKAYHTRKSHEISRYSFCFFDLFEASPLPCKPISLAILTGLLSRFSLDAKRTVLRNVYHSIPWSTEAVLIVDRVTLDDIDCAELASLFKIKSVFQFLVPRDSLLDKMKNWFRKRFFFYNDRFEINCSEADALSLDRSASFYA